jgi:tetratricopeptide (TPR) repeat protein
MIKRTLGFLFVLMIVAVVAFNFKRILSLGQANEIRQKAGPAIEGKDWDKAISIYQAGTKQYPDNAFVSLRLAWLYQQVDKPDQAEHVYRAVLQREPDNEDASMMLARLLEATPKRINEAVVILRGALKAHPREPRLLSEIGNLYKTAAENPEEQREGTKKWLYEQARYYYQASLKENPRQFKTQFNLGVVYQDLDQLQPAADAYCQAIILVPDRYEPHYNLGVVLTGLDYFDEAYRQLDQSVRILLAKGQTGDAQSLALKVQIVKNGVFNSGKQGLGRQSIPPFLKDKACLVKSVPTTPDSSTTQRNE